MNKLLTISIAAYNSEEYIRETLESLVVRDHMELIEVFIIDDGGTDGTLDIAQEYCEKYPGTFVPVHKDNGGYGSTVNYSISHATGKYFKLLDGDDWFDKDSFEEMIAVLQEEDSDVIVTNYYKGPSASQMDPVKTHTEADGEVVDLRDGYMPKEPFDMWSLVYKTSLLRENSVVLPEKVLYTDRYYATIPFAYANTVRFSDTYVYCYRIGRDGQSMSIESQIRHYEERSQGSIDLCRFYADQKKKGNPRCKYLLVRVTACHLGAAGVVMHMEKGSESKAMLQGYEETVAGISKDVIRYEKYKGEFGLFMSLCRNTRYLVYWMTPDFIMKKV